MSVALERAGTKVPVGEGIRRVPRLTIGLPVYNGENFLAEQIESLLDQTFGDFELIISDNASTDGTEEICRSFASRDDRIRYIRNETNIGPVANYNQLVHLARGEFFKWAAHDDVHAPDFLRCCVEALDARPEVVLAFTKRVRFGEGIEPVEMPYKADVTSPHPSRRFGQLLRQPYACIPAIFGVIRRDTLLRTHLQPQCLGGDHVLLAQLSLFGAFVEVPEILFYDRAHADRCSRLVSVKDRVTWWHPDAKGDGAALWKQIWAFPERGQAYLRAVRGSPLSWTEKLRCYSYLPAWISFHLRARIRRLVLGPRGMIAHANGSAARPGRASTH